MRLPKSLSAEERFQRVESVIEQIGLTVVKDTVVGGSTGPGLSGGQKRRLAVAIQLLSLPRILFLDEPTSGLDATSSMEVLRHLQCLAGSGRLVILTIHQPRLEIFHMFDRILLLCQGEVAYYGSPTEAPALFLKAYQVAKLEGDAPVLDHQKNPADFIMDMLGSESYRRAILSYYKMTFELKAVKNAVRLSRRAHSHSSLQADKEQADSGWRNRFLVLETRAHLRTSLAQSIYLPAIFLTFSLVAGLAYLQAESMLLIMAALSIYSFASSIFMFPPVYNHLSKALEVCLWLYTVPNQDT
jgi:ABC-type multidrug transport system ATPase subunit